MHNKFLFTSESVGVGHPDKICDQISDSILDAHLRIDPKSKVAVEAMVSPNLVVIAGEVSSSAAVDYEQIARKVLKNCGYTAEKGIDPDGCSVIVNINKQSIDISRAVSEGGAGDQGMMFGYATNETKERIPLSLYLSHRLVAAISESSNNILGPDCKSQVTVEYLNQDGELVPLRIDTVVMSVQHPSDMTIDTLRLKLREIVDKVIPQELLRDTKFLLQPTIFTIGGPAADTGLTGRKIIVDTYGGFGCHGGGAFSGKDSTKVDRSGAYVARWIAKSLVDSGIAKRILVQLSYAIGIDHPVSINIDTYGTSKYNPDEIIRLIQSNFDLSPAGIIRDLNLDTPIFSRTAVYGHFGREEFPWEKSKELKF